MIEIAHFATNIEAVKPGLRHRRPGQQEREYGHAYSAGRVTQT